MYRVYRIQYRIIIRVTIESRRETSNYAKEELLPATTSITDFHGCNHFEKRVLLKASLKTHLWSSNHYGIFSASSLQPSATEKARREEGWEKRVRQGDKMVNWGNIFQVACVEKCREFLSLGAWKIKTRPMYVNALPITACDSTNRKALGQITCRVGRRF